jgi:hypothetical protein
VSLPLHFWDKLVCAQRGCHNPVVSVVVAEAGCAVMPEDQVQPLCLQHLVGMESSGEIYEIATRLEREDDGGL